MILRVDGTVYRGRVVTLPRSLDPGTVARAVRTGTASGGEVTLSVVARTPHPTHEHVGCLTPEGSVRVRTALAAAARARGYGTRYDDALRQARQELSEFGAGSIDASGARETVADSSADTARLRERVATLRGKLQARREAGLPTDRTRERLEDAARELSEAETTATAARQTLERERREGREVRDVLEERLRLEDRVANLERRARAVLVDRVRDAYAAAVATVPGGPGEVPGDPFDVDSLTGGLAVARVADFDGPVVLSCDRFERARTASRWLGAPVVEV